MKAYFSFVAALFLLTVLAACSTLTVSTDLDTSYDFGKLKSYAWLDSSAPVSADARVNNDLIVSRVRAAVEKNLEDRGLVKTDKVSADMLVSWFGAIDTKLQVESIDHFYSPYGYGPLHRDSRWVGGVSGVRTTTAREYEVGTLVIDVLDPVAHKLIWRGTGQDRIGKKKQPEQVTKGINEAVTAIMKDFPVVKKY